MKKDTVVDNDYANLKGAHRRTACHDHRSLCHRSPGAQGIEAVRYSSNEEIFMDLASAGWMAYCRYHSTGAGFPETPWPGLRLVGPELKDPHYVGEGSGYRGTQG